MANILKLRKCAYIFDSSYGNFFYGTKEAHAKRYAVQRHMKQYYDSEEMRNTPIEYTIDENDHIIIMIDNQPHYLNDLQIASIDGLDSVINHRRIIDATKIETKNFHLFCTRFLHSNHFKSLNFEFFTGIEDLGYIRVNFKGYSERFIIDDRDGTLYTSGECGRHKPITAKEIANRLDLQSAKVRNEFYEMIEAITGKEI